MRVKELPDRDEYRELLESLKDRLHAIVHFRIPDRKSKKVIQELKKLIGRYWAIETNRFDHVAVAVDHEGHCWIGKTQLQAADQYRRKTGFGLAVQKALACMKDQVHHFEIGINPPFRNKDLNRLVGTRLKAFRIQPDWWD